VRAPRTIGHDSVAPTPVPAAAGDGPTSQRGDIQQTLAYSGDIRSREQVSVLPRAPGASSGCWSMLAAASRLATHSLLSNRNSAQIAALQARATLAGAEASWRRCRSAQGADDVAAAEAGLIQQTGQLQNMLAGRPTEDILAGPAALEAQQARLDLMCKVVARSCSTGAAAVDSPMPNSPPSRRGSTNDIQAGGR